MKKLENGNKWKLTFLINNQPYLIIKRPDGFHTIYYLIGTTYGFTTYKG